MFRECEKAAQALRPADFAWAFGRAEVRCSRCLRPDLSRTLPKAWAARGEPEWRRELLADVSWAHGLRVDGCGDSRGSTESRRLFCACLSVTSQKASVRYWPG